MNTRTKRLFVAVPTDYAHSVYQHGFTASERPLYDPDELANGPYVKIESRAFVEFRDMPPVGLTFSLTAEATVEGDPDDDHRVNVTIDGGPVLADYLGDFVLAIEVPDDEELHQMEIHEDPPLGWPFREYWLEPEVANQYLRALKVFVPETREEIPAELLGRDDAVIITQRFGLSEPLVVGARCVCGGRFRQLVTEREEQRAAFARWSAEHR